MGFDIHIDTQMRATTHDYVAVTDFAISGGKFYYRDTSEVDRAVVKVLSMA